jgi:hypothetical protein
MPEHHQAKQTGQAGDKMTKNTLRGCAKALSGMVPLSPSSPQKTAPQQIADICEISPTMAWPRNSQKRIQTRADDAICGKALFSHYCGFAFPPASQFCYKNFVLPLEAGNTML